MNENIDLTKILRDCPEGWPFYSSTVGRVTFVNLDLDDPEYPITVQAGGGIRHLYYTKKGWLYKDYSDAECTLFPSKDQRDWSKFTAPWYNKEKFDPKTLQSFDKVLVRYSRSFKWRCQLFSHLLKDDDYFCACIYSSYRYGNCMPYNDDTRHLVGTTDEAPEFYRYWE